VRRRGERVAGVGPPGPAFAWALIFTAEDRNSLDGVFACALTSTTGLSAAFASIRFVRDEAFRTMPAIESAHGSSRQAITSRPRGAWLRSCATMGGPLDRT
jgi:hypothetical protein